MTREKSANDLLAMEGSDLKNQFFKILNYFSNQSDMLPSSIVSVMLPFQNVRCLPNCGRTLFDKVYQGSFFKKKQFDD